MRWWEEKRGCGCGYSGKKNGECGGMRRAAGVDMCV